MSFLNNSIGTPVCFNANIKLLSLLLIYSRVKDGDASRSSFFVQDSFGYLGFFVGQNEVEYFSFEVCEKVCWDFDGDCIESVDYFW